MLTLTLPKRTWAHGIPVGVKLLGLLVVTTLLFPVTDLMFLSGALGAMVALTATLGRTALHQTLRFLMPLWPILALLLGYHAVIGDLRAGIAICLKLLAMVGLANWVTMTSRLAEMMIFVEKGFRPFRIIGLNPRIVSTAVGLVVRFTPVLIQRARALNEAWRARSIKSPRWRLIAPIGVAALDDADLVSDALKARGGLSPRATEK